jgi:hypothetical protein
MKHRDGIDKLAKVHSSLCLPFSTEIVHFRLLRDMVFHHLLTRGDLEMTEKE